MAGLYGRVEWLIMGIFLGRFIIDVSFFTFADVQESNLLFHLCHVYPRASFFVIFIYVSPAISPFV